MFIRFARSIRALPPTILRRSSIKLVVITNAYPHSESCEQAKECAERLGEGFTRRGLNVSFSLCSRNAIYNISLHDLTEIVDQVSGITFSFFSFWKLETRINNDRSRLIFCRRIHFLVGWEGIFFFKNWNVLYMKSREIIEQRLNVLYTKGNDWCRLCYSQKSDFLSGYLVHLSRNRMVSIVI